MVLCGGSFIERKFMYQPPGNVGYIYLRILAAERAMLSKAEVVLCIDYRSIGKPR